MNTTVLLVAYHGDKWLPACLDSLPASSWRRIQLVLVDNGGNTIIDDLDLSPFDAEVISTPHPMGFADANNYGLMHASRLEEAVVFLNQDTISTEDWIDECTDQLKSIPSLGAVSPLISTYDGYGWDASFLACFPQEDEIDTLRSRGELVKAKNAPAPALVVRTDALREAGPFDPVFGSYYEDYDLCRRMRAAGYDIAFCCTAVIRHFSGSVTNTASRERRRMRQIIRNRHLYRLREHDGARFGALLRVVIDLPLRLARGILRTPSSQPPLTTLLAFADLIKLGPRLISHRADQRAWQEVLHHLGWPPHSNIVRQ